MGTQTFKSENWYNTYQLVLTLGFILSIGSIASFIVMNVLFGETSSIDSIYWQRLFVSKTTYFLIIPGVCLILASTIILTYNSSKKDIWLIIVQILVVLIVLNSIHITLLADKVTTIATYQKEILANIKEYVELKSREDVFGGVNLLMLLVLLGISNYKFKR